MTDELASISGQYGSGKSTLLRLADALGQPMTRVLNRADDLIDSLDDIGLGRELLRRLQDAQRAAMADPTESVAALLLEGLVLRLSADLHWLETYEDHRTDRAGES